MPIKDYIRKAVALKYDPKVHFAPEVIAKGQGGIAEGIIQQAKEHDVPVYEDKDLVEVLSKLEMGTKIPVELYQPIAQILVFFHLLNKGMNENVL